MIANNGLAGDSGFDRKGFRYGIEAARRTRPSYHNSWSS